jgi:5-oxopent-3-ene-1,2,5-tricarboxylate decarboxylase/2-hydroxyhepta-2,4-diene-1,7-dioate isomerase
MIGGTAYGVVLNDRAELDALAPAFIEPPYRSPPDAPVLYIKPRNTLVASGAGVALPPDLPRVSVAATLALAISDLGRPSAARLALDVSEPHSTYFRPAVRERCRDNFLPLGAPGPLPAGSEEIVTLINGAEAHRWSLDRLQRPIDALLAAIGGFMSLLPGDLLLIGLPGDAPLAGVGDRVEVRCEGYPPLMVTLTEEAA